jgi:cell surface protein SprA
MYEKNTFDFSEKTDLNNNYIAQYEFATVSITEQFSPLIGVDITMKNSLSTRVEIKKSRNLNLSLVNNQIMEIRSDELVVGVGYRFNEVPLVIRSAGGQRDFESDLNVRADVSIRDNKTILRRLDAIIDPIANTSVNEASAGQNVVTIKFTADYVLSDRFNLRFFFDRVVNNPLVSTSFPTANTEVGFSVRFTLIQ